LLSIACLASNGCSVAGAEQQGDELLIPDLDRTRTERLGVLGGRFVTPPGFSVEEVASDELVGSIVNMTFDHRGRPALSGEGTGIKLLIDRDSDGRYDTVRMFSDAIQTAHGMLYIGPGDLLVNSEGLDGPGLYRLTDTDGDDRADLVSLIAPSTAEIQEHGPHTILRGPDGFYYVLYGNHAHPDVELDQASPSRGLQEDHLLPRYLDPRGHANSIRAPGGTIHRLSPDLEEWSQLAAGFRNPFDMAADVAGELFAYDADMEWDVGLPWFRPTRVVHVIPGGDYGWRTGSSKFPFYYLDTLPGVDDIGRGSPVGVAFYQHHVYPERFKGALFLGDWSRGRIRVVFPERDGASYAGETLDFVLGEPLNITDLDIGPDGFLYFSTGGRSTTGGLYRVRYTGPPGGTRAEGTALDRILEQPMPRSAWGREAIERAREELGELWEPELRAAALDTKRASEPRLRALEALQVLGPQPDRSLLGTLLDEPDPKLRAAAVYLLGTLPFGQVHVDLTEALADPDAFVVRRACEALVRAGLDDARRFGANAALPARLFDLLGHRDRFVRYAARLALLRVEHTAWVDRVSGDDVEAHPRRSVEGVLALVYAQRTPEETALVFAKLEEYGRAAMDDEILLGYLRVLQLALIRDPAPDASHAAHQALIAQVGPRLLARFPGADSRVNRELQVVLAHMQTPGVIDALLDHLTPDRSQQEQIHTVYALRVIGAEWTPEQRRRLMAWFDRARTFRGAASMTGYIDFLWESALERLTDDERQAARARREESLAANARRAAELAAPAEEDDPPDTSAKLAHMSFQELSEYLEYDPMAYSRGDAEKGRRLFYRARCVDCHVFGAEGRGGGPDLSTVVTRFRRQEILESIMYPSRVISDQYTALRVETGDDVVVGMLADETASTLTLIDANGKRIEMPQEAILDRRPSSVSIMPEGLLHAMSLQDLVNLVVFLERGAPEGPDEVAESGSRDP
jgi:putative membrane-bound dehydrogenase-like protein